jgi:hypothetical protein
MRGLRIWCVTDCGGEGREGDEVMESMDADGVILT